MSRKPPQSDSSWDTYQLELSQTTDTLLYRVLGPFRSLVYGETVKEIREADAIRSDIQSRFETLRETGRGLKSKLENQARTPLRQGDRLNDDAVTTLTELEDTVDEINTLLTEYTRFLTTTEQSQLQSLQHDSHDLINQVRAKHEIDKELDDIKDNVQALATTVEREIPNNGDGILDEEIKEELISNIERVQSRINTVSNVTDGNNISQADQDRRDDLAGELDALHDCVTNHNEDTVQKAVGKTKRDCEACIEHLAETIRSARTADTIEYGRSYDDVLNTTSDVLEAIAELTGTRKREYLDADQVDDLEHHRDRINSQREIVQTLSTVTTELTALATTIEDLQDTIDNTLDYDSFLTTPRREELQDQYRAACTEFDSLLENVTVEDLPDAYQGELRELENTVNEVYERLDEYNEEFIARKQQEYADVFSGMGEDNLSLNKQQELAVFRNDIHNQVNAGAGTGKTFSLSCRVKYLVEEGVEEDDILALTFLSKATDEMETRLDDMFDVTRVDTETLHAFGNHVLEAVDPSLVQLEDETRLREVSRVVSELKDADSDFRSNYVEFKSLFEDKRLQDDRDEREEFVESLEHQSGTTLLGEDIVPYYTEEKTAHNEIAAALFRHGIEYRYQQYAAWADTPGEEPYIPDFTLPQYGVCIEFRPSKPTRRRKKPYERKRTQDELDDIFTDSGQSLLTIPGDDVDAQRAGEVVIESLSNAGVNTGSTRDRDDIVDTAYRRNVVTRSIESLFADFIKKAKTNQIDPATKLGRIDEEEDPELFHFTLAATRVLQAYNDRYDEYNAYDFVDMIVMATDAINEGRVDDMASYEHIIVDEFQDLNLVQIKFIQALLGRRDDSRLFAVGDDWQSIYGFKSARPDYFIEFEEHFAPATRTRLETNYRCPPSVVQAGNTLIQHNDAKTTKTVRAASDVETRPRVHTVSGSSEYQYEENAIQRIVELVQESVETNDRDAGEVMVLARNREGSRFIRDVERELRGSGVSVGGDDGVQVMTAHQSKGNEAEHVIIANAAAGARDGFPAKERDRNLTEMVEINTGSHLDEERRLFYVGVTRAEERLDIQTRSGQESPFISEIEQHVTGETVGVDCTVPRVTVTVTVQDQKESKSYWNTRQLGTVITDDGFELNFAMSDETTHELLSKGRTYRLSNAKIGEYDGHPQLQLDAETIIHRE